MELIAQKLKDALTALYGEKLSAADFSLDKVAVTPAPENQSADYATNVAMQITKIVGEPPRTIAEQLKDRLDCADFQVEIAGPGFLNFTLSDRSLLDSLAHPAAPLDQTGKTIICEFSDPNPFKVLHVGHLYTSVVGDAIARLLENTGARVIRANFGGDVGLHVAKNLYIMLQQQDEMEKLTAPEVTSDARAEFMAHCYVEGTNA